MERKEGREGSPLRELLSGGLVNLIPFLSGEWQIGAFGGVPDPLGIHGAQIYLDIGRVPCNPRHGDGRIGHLIFFCEPVDCPV